MVTVEAAGLAEGVGCGVSENLTRGECRQGDGMKVRHIKRRAKRPDFRMRRIIGTLVVEVKSSPAAVRFFGTTAGRSARSGVLWGKSMTKRVAPWPDYEGNEYFQHYEEGDELFRARIKASLGLAAPE
jgi:hypothetical protein